MNDLGDTVDLVATTDENGAFSFTGLRAGAYSIWETQPPGFDDGFDYIGSLGGQQATNPDTGFMDAFTDIQLFDGQNGINYIFTEKINE